jgi:hypothetical protein
MHETMPHRDQTVLREAISDAVQQRCKLRPPNQNAKIKAAGAKVVGFIRLPVSSPGGRA